jgi:hypothetical protein
MGAVVRLTTLKKCAECPNFGYPAEIAMKFRSLVPLPAAKRETSALFEAIFYLLHKN